VPDGYLAQGPIGWNLSSQGMSFKGGARNNA
jgi:hypothetical protein